MLESYQHTETNLAQSYALEVEGGLNTYETLISYGTHMIDARDQEGDTEEELRNRIQQYCLRIQTVLDDQVDPYVVYDGKIIAANPWEGDDSYDYTSAVWYQKAMEADGQVVFTDVYTDAIYNRTVVTVAQKCADSDAVVAMDIFPENLPSSPGAPAPRRAPPSSSVIPAAAPSIAAPTWMSPRSRSRATSTGFWRRWTAAGWPATTPLSQGWTGCGGASTMPKPATAGR